MNSEKILEQSPKNLYLDQANSFFIRYENELILSKIPEQNESHLSPNSCMTIKKMSEEERKI